MSTSTLKIKAYPPLILAGLRLHTTITIRSCSCSKGMNLARPLTTTRGSAAGRERGRKGRDGWEGKLQYELNTIITLHYGSVTTACLIQ